MRMHIDEGTLNSMARIEALLDGERAALQLRELESLETTEPGLRSVLNKIMETHRQMCAELEE